MPQLDQLWSYPSQIFWLAVCFIVLFFILSRIALPRVSDLLQERQERIDSDLEKAEQLKKEAEGVLEAYESAMSDARGKAQAQIRETAAKLAEDAARQHAELTSKLSQDAEAAEQRIDAARREALGNVQTVASEVAAAAVSRLVGGQVSQTDADAAVAGAIKERG
jgi:F-type H+-transporting ATPase subunit b